MARAAVGCSPRNTRHSSPEDPPANTSINQTTRTSAMPPPMHTMRLMLSSRLAFCCSFTRACGRGSNTARRGRVGRGGTQAGHRHRPPHPTPHSSPQHPHSSPQHHQTTPQTPLPTPLPHSHTSTRSAPISVVQGSCWFSSSLLSCCCTGRPLPGEPCCCCCCCRAAFLFLSSSGW